MGKEDCAFVKKSRKIRPKQDLGPVAWYTMPDDGPACIASRKPQKGRTLLKMIRPTQAEEDLFFYRADLERMIRRRLLSLKADITAGMRAGTLLTHELEQLAYEHPDRLGKYPEGKDNP